MAAAGAFLGLALSSRANFLLVAPIVIGAVGRRSGCSRVALFAYAAITTPFYLYDRATYTPPLSYQNYRSLTLICRTSEPSLV